MTNESEKMLSAQVVLKADAPTQPEEVMREFARAGFSTGAFYANTFSIAADAGKFEKLFGVKPESTSRAGIKVLKQAQPDSLTLPLDNLPPSLAENVETVLFTKPPDFGPNSY